MNSSRFFIPAVITSPGLTSPTPAGVPETTSMLAEEWDRMKTEKKNDECSMAEKLESSGLKDKRVLTSKNKIAFFESHDRTNMGNDFRNTKSISVFSKENCTREDHVRSISALFVNVVDFEPQIQVLRVHHFITRNILADWAKRVPAFPFRPKMV